MISLITSAIAGTLIVVFLGYYAVTLHQPPLWAVIGVVLVMVITDFAITTRDEIRQTRRRKEDNGNDAQQG